jgi:hypothetical protein
MNLDGYVPVTDRLKAALTEHPELRVVETGHEIVEVAGDTVLICSVAVHRCPDDPLPTLGTASEPFPGRTPYTKGSELMVGYTSALGRALGYMGYGIDKAIASADEVRAAEERRPIEIGSKARRAPSEPWDDAPPPMDPDEPVRPAGRRKEPTEKMVALYKKLIVERGWEVDPDVLADFDATKAQIDHLIAHKD